VTLGRSEDEFWRMTPAKLHAVSELHNSVLREAHSGTDEPSRKPSVNPAADLAAFSSDFA
jgi:hypothetical protein